MTDKKVEDHVLMLEDVRIAFPELFVPKQVNNQGKAAYSACFLMPPSHPVVMKVKTAIATVAKAKWPTEYAEILPALVAGDKVCLHNGDMKANYDGFPGNLYVSARGQMAPLVIGQDPNVKLTALDGKPYSGCYVNAQVAIWAQQNQYGKRVNAQIRGVQFLRDGEAFGAGAVSAPDDFEPVDAGADDDAPAAADANEWGNLI